MKKLFAFVIFLAVFILNTPQVEAGYVRGYYRSNGTYVRPHYRSNPNSTKVDNYGAASYQQRQATKNDPVLHSYNNDQNNDGIKNKDTNDDDGDGINDDAEQRK